VEVIVNSGNKTAPVISATGAAKQGIRSQQMPSIDNLCLL